MLLTLSISFSFHRKGVFHSTFVGCSRRTLDKVTIKEMHLRNYPSSQEAASAKEDAESLVTSEILVLSRLNHECLPKLKEVFLTDSSCFLVTNYLDPARLSHYVDVRAHSTQLHVADVRRIAKSLCSALAHCHDHGVIVRDLSPSSIMLRKSGVDAKTGGALKLEVVIADFSLAVPQNSAQVLSDHPLFDWSLVPYTAPEALLGGAYSYPMDCWSLGVLMYVLFSGHEPFFHDDDHVLVQNIRTASFDFDEDAFDSVDESAKTAISHVLKVTPTKRWTAQQFLKCPWLVSA